MPRITAAQKKKILAMISWIAYLFDRMPWNVTAAQIEERLQAAKDIEIGEEYGPYVDQARQERDRVISALTDALDKVNERDSRKAKMNEVQTPETRMRTALKQISNILSTVPTYGDDTNAQILKITEDALHG